MFCHWNPLACGTARGLCHTGSKMHFLFFWVLNRICSLLFHYTWIKHRKSYLQLSAISTHSAGRGFSLSCSSLNRVCVCLLAALILSACPWCHCGIGTLQQCKTWHLLSSACALLPGCYWQKQTVNDSKPAERRKKTSLGSLEGFLAWAHFCIFI